MQNRILVIFIIGVLILTTYRAHAQLAQEKTIEGAVVDSLGVGLKGVNIRLTSTMDTFFTTSNNSGSYSFRNVQGQNVSISYSLLGRKPVKKSIPDYLAIEHIYVPLVVLMPQSSEIEAVHILKTIPIVYKGDTTVFNMSAFSYLKNSLLEDVLKNSLPGFQVLRDGTTFYNGKIITSVQVDGRKFFGGDLLTATRNLPADFIKQLEVIDHYGDASEEKGIKNTEPEKIINIILKEDRKKIMFGQATAGGGTSDRYIGSVGLNNFDSGREVSFVASVNNTNTSLFTFGSPNGAGGRSSLSDVGDYADQADGLNKMTSAGITFSDDITTGINISGGYNFTRRENVTVGNSLLSSTYEDYIISKNDEYRSTLNDNFHKVNLELNARFKNQDMLKISPSFTYNKFNKYNVRDNVLRNRRLTNRGTYQDSSVNENPNAQVNILYSKYFQKKGRKLVGDFNIDYNSTRKLEEVSESYINRLDSLGAPPVITSFDQEQFVYQRNHSNSVRASVSYVEPFFTNSLLEISHEYELTQIDAMRRVEMPIDDIYQQVDSLGIDYGYLFNSNRTGLTYQYEPNNRFRVNMGFAVQPLLLKGRVPKDTLIHEYTNVNLVPSATVKYRFNDELDWQFAYYGRNNQPNFLHISPIRDNSNSRNIIVGNPMLRAEFVNKLSTTFRKSIISKAQYFELNFAYNFTNNKIVSSKTATSNETSQETTFENADGYYELKGYYMFNTPFVNDNLQLDISGNLDYFNNIVFVNNVRGLTKQYLYSQNLQLRYNWQEYFESVFNTSYLLNRASFEIPREDKIAAHSLLFSLGGRSYLNDKLMIGAEMSQKIFRGYAVDITDVSPTIINGYIEYSFLKNKLALLRLQCFDMLDQNKNVGVTTEYFENNIYESRNNRLGRYFMLTLNMRLQKFPKAR